MTTSRTVTIGAASRLTGVEQWRLRRWEASGLLAPARSPSGYRLYRQSDLDRIVELAETAEQGDRMSLHALASGPEPDPVWSPRPTSSTGGSIDDAAHRILRWLVERIGATWGVLIMPRGYRSDEPLTVVAAVSHAGLAGYRLTAGEERDWHQALRNEALISNPALGPVQAGSCVAAPITVADLRGGILVGRHGQAAVLALASAVALALAQALLRDRDHGQLQAREREADLLRATTHDLAGAAEVDGACDAALAVVMEMLGAECGAVSLADSGRQRYELAAHRGLSEDYVGAIGSWRLNEGIAGRAFASQEAVVVPDLQADPRVTRSAVRREGLRAFLAVPMLNRGRAIGVLEVFSHSRRGFGHREIQFVRTVAASLALAVAGIRADADLDRMRADRSQVLRDWSAQVSRVGDAQRARLADRLHDEVVMPLRRSAQSPVAIERLSELVGELRYPGSTGANIAAVLAGRSAQIGASRTGREAEVIVDDSWPAELPVAMAARLLAVLTELQEGAAVAAQARSRLTLGRSSDGHLRIEVAHDRPTSVDPSTTIPDPVREQLTALDATASAAASDDDLETVLRIRVPPAAVAGPGALTARQRNVLRALAGGASNRAIAAELGISPKTLQNHLTAIYRVLGVSSRGQAIPLGVALLESPVGAS